MARAQESVLTSQTVAEAKCVVFVRTPQVNLPLSAAAVVAVVVRSSRPSHLRTAMGAQRLVVGNLSSTRSDPPTQATLPRLQNAHKKATCGIAMGARTETCSAALSKILSPPNFTAAICPYDHARPQRALLWGHSWTVLLRFRNYEQARPARALNFCSQLPYSSSCEQARGTSSSTLSLPSPSPSCA